MILKNKEVRITNLTIGLLSILAVVGGFYMASTQQALGAPDDSSYKLVWEDNFDGTELNTNNWDYQTGAWGASEIQACYKMNTNNVNVGGGTLKLTALYEPGVACSGSTRDFTSGFVQTRNKKYWTYGYIEARIKMPNNNGSTWPAFWMSPNDAVYGGWPRSGEIDIFEAKGHDSNYLAANAHWGIASNQKRQHQGNTNVNTLSPNGTADWHTYGVKWQEGRLDFYIDGQHFHTVDNFRDPNATTHPGPFNIPFYIRLNLAIGGTYLTPPHNDAHNNADKFPTTMEIDYVRVYQKSDVNAETVNIPDNNLRKLINETLASTTGQQRTANQAITTEEIKNISRLYRDLGAGAPASDKITDLTGLEKAVNLVKMSLVNNNVRSVAPLANLTHINDLNLKGNAVTDISPLSGLTKLATLNLGLQKATLNTTTASFASPLKNESGATVAIQNSSTLINDGTNTGNLKLVSPVYDGQAHAAQAPWTTDVTIGSATTTFSGTLTVNAILPQPVDLAALQSAIAAAESEPSYIQNDTAVAAALTRARSVVAQTNPSQTDVQNAANDLNNAVTSAKQKEQNARTAAETAVAAAENSKRPSDVTAAQAKVNAVQDPANKAAFQARLNAVNSTISSALSALNSLITTAKDSATIAGMSSSTVAALQSQIAAAETVANNSNSSASELDNARAALQTKIDALRADTSALQAAIAAAENEPSYIQNDTAVQNTLTTARAVIGQENPSQSDIQSATTNLNNAVANAKQKEQAAQSAAETAVTKAENNKRPSDVTAAQTKVNAVQDPAKKGALQARLTDVTNKITAAKTNLSNEISSAESQPDYIKNDSSVASKLSDARTVINGADSSVSDMTSAKDALNQAVTTAVNSEQSAQRAAETAVATAESDKTQEAINAAQVLVNKVQDPAKKQALQTRLDAVVVPAPNPPTPPTPSLPTTSVTVAQPNGSSITVSADGDKCYNIASATAATAPGKHNRRVLRDIAEFTIDCHNQTAEVGYTTNVTLILSRLYRNTNKLTVAKVTNGTVVEDITDKITFGTTPDGRFTTISYNLTDGGFGDQDGIANGVIVDPLGIYEEEDNASGTSVAGANNNATLADTGNSLLAIISGGVAISLAGVALIRRR